MAFAESVKKLLLGLIRIYKYCISSLLGNCCRFEPSCSEYAMMAIEEYGCLKGGWLTFKRLLRCHPWCPGGYDPVPPLTKTNARNSNPS